MDTLVDLASGGERRARGRELLTLLVARSAGVEADDVAIVAVCPDCGGDHGRPTAVVGDQRIEIGLAHAGEWSVAAVCDDVIGIDAELRATDRARVAAVAELLGLDTDDPVNVLRRWTSVEAVLKADGRGLRVDPNEVAVDGDTAQLGGDAYELEALELHPELIVTLARRRPESTVEPARSASDRRAGRGSSS